MTQTSGSAPFAFAYRDDLHTIPTAATDLEVNLHGGFAVDKRDGFGQIYYGMADLGIVRIDADMTQQDVIALPDKLKPLNFHSTKIGVIGGEQRLFLPANNDELVAVVDLEGKLDFTLSRPEFEQYASEDVPYNPTDTVLVEDTLYVADGYGANYISSADVNTKEWKDTFGGKTEDSTENGKFGTAHGLNLDHHHDHLFIADRLHSRVQVHNFDGEFHHSHGLPSGAWPCGIDTIEWEGRSISVIGCLYGTDPEKTLPAPIYIVDADTFEILSTVQPKVELGVELAQRLHNVVWHVHNGNLFLICQSWNPGFYFVLERVA